MEEAILKKAEILVEAYSYIKEFKNKTFVIKIGGSLYQIEGAVENILYNVAFCEVVGIKIVVVCGGGPFINAEIEKREKKTVFVDGLRITDEETLEIVKNVVFKVRDDIVKRLKEKYSLSPYSLNPEEKVVVGKKIHYQKGEEIIDLGYVGIVKDIDTEKLNELLEKHRIVVITPVVIGEDGLLYNVNGDNVAAIISEKIKSEKLIYLTNVFGVMRNFENPDTLISVLNTKQAEELIKEQIIKGGMLPKVRNSISAIKTGVKKVHVISGNIPNSLILEVFTEHGVETEIIE